MPQYSFNGTNFIVGRDAEDNWKIILGAYKDYYWVHADNIPSAHVIIEIDEPLQEEFQYACDLCKKHTNFDNKTTHKNKSKDKSKNKVNNNNSIQFVTTKIENIKLGSKPGEVFFKDSTKTSILI